VAPSLKNLDLGSNNRFKQRHLWDFLKLSIVSGKVAKKQKLARGSSSLTFSFLNEQFV